MIQYVVLRVWREPERAEEKKKRGRNARVAQWWSIALPRRGSRVRIPSRALVKALYLQCFYYFCDKIHDKNFKRRIRRK